MTDEFVADALARAVPRPTSAGDWDDVLVRASRESTLDSEAAVARKRRWQARSLVHKRRIGAVAVAVALAGVAGGSAFAIFGSGSSPGLTSGVSALDQLPPIKSLPDSATRPLGRLSLSGGVATSDATRTMRRLRSGLPQGDLYAFRSNGKICFFLTRGAGLCPENMSSGDRGLNWLVSAGSPGEPSALVAIVADNVGDVALVDGVTREDLPIANNSIYAPLPTSASGEGILLVARYRDGTQTEVRVPNPNAQ